jgi:FecR protein
MSPRRTWFTLAWIALSCISHSAHADMAKLRVKEVSGDVMITAAGAEQRATVGLLFSPPAEVRTGATGAILLADAETTLRISANSVVVIPSSAQPSGMIDRILQRSGSVLYNVNSRKGRPFAVETALLTSVVKGTLFSVNVQGQSAVVALLEGSLEVSGLGADQSVLLSPGDAAHRNSGERGIRVDRQSAASLIPATPRATPRSAMPQWSADSRGTDRALQDLAQVTAAIGLAPPVAVPPPVDRTPHTPPATSSPSAPQPTPPPPDPTPPTPATTPPATPTPVVTPPVSTPPVTPPIVTPPVATPPISSPTPPLPTDDDDDNKSGKGSRHGRARGQEQGHGEGNDDRDHHPD